MGALQVASLFGVLDLQDNMTPGLEKAHGKLEGFAGFAKGAFKGAMVAGAFGLGVLGSGIGLALHEAMDAEVNIAKLEAVIKSTGGVAGVTSKEAQDLADSLSHVTRYSDDTILSAETMLLTFTNIGEDVFPQATEALLDMGEMFGSADQAAIMLGKALQDPVQGVTALRRVGVQLSDEQERQIKNFMALGDVESAQKIILEELNKEMGGVARAAGQTLAGKLTILKNRFLNVAEALGMKLLPPLFDLVSGVGGRAADWAEQMGYRFGQLVDAIETFGLDSHTAAMRFKEIFGETVGGALPGVIHLIMDLADAMGGLLHDAVLPLASAGLDLLRTGLDLLMIPIRGIIDVVGELASIWSDNWGRIQGVIDTVGSVLGGLWDRAVSAGEDIAAGLKSGIGSLWDVVKNFLGDKIGELIAKAKEVLGIGSPSTVFIQIGHDIVEGLKMGLMALWGIVAGVFGSILIFATPVFIAVKNWLEVAWPTAVSAARTAFEEKLLPALQNVWGYIQANFEPAMDTVARLIGLIIPVATAILTGAWNLLLIPAFERVKGLIGDDLIPNFGKLQEKIQALTVEDVLWGIGEALGAIDPNTIALLALAFAGLAAAELLAYVPLLLFAGLIAALQTDFGGLSGAIDQVGAGLREGDLKKTLDGIVDALFAIPMGIAGWIGAQIGIDVPEGMHAWFGVIEQLGIILKAIPGYIGDWISKQAEIIVNDPLSLLRTIFDALKTAIGFLPGGLGEFMKALMELQVPQALKDIADFIQKILDGIATITGFGGGGGGYTPEEVQQMGQQVFGHDFPGSYSAGQPYTIGTGAQPELWVPGESGTAYPAGRYGGMGGGGINMQGATIILQGVQDPDGLLDKLEVAARRRNRRVTVPA